MPEKMIGFRPSTELAQFIDCVRGDLTRGECAKVIIMWLQQYETDYAKRQVEHFVKLNKPSAPMKSGN